jgi:hypothetical protein
MIQDTGNKFLSETVVYRVVIQRGLAGIYQRFGEIHCFQLHKQFSFEIMVFTS